MTTVIILFIVFIMAYIVIIEIFTVLFRLTGLTEEKARFQVISMLTSTGFTTDESDLIIRTPRRRRLARYTILFGYGFTVIIVSILVNFILKLSDAQMRHIIVSAISFGILFVFLYLVTNIGVKKRFDMLIEQICFHLMHGKQTNTYIIIDKYGKSSIVSVHFKNMPEYINKVPFSEGTLRRKYGLIVLAIQRNGVTIEHITANDYLQKDDTAIIYGSYNNIKDAFGE